MIKHSTAWRAGWRVLEERRLEARASLRVMNQRPAVVLPSLDKIKFIAAARAIEPARPVFSFKQEIRSGLKVDTLRIAMTVRPNFGSRVFITNEGIENMSQIKSLRYGGSNITYENTNVL